MLPPEIKDKAYAFIDEHASVMESMIMIDSFKLWLLEDYLRQAAGVTDLKYGSNKWVIPLTNEWVLKTEKYPTYEYELSKEYEIQNTLKETGLILELHKVRDYWYLQRRGNPVEKTDENIIRILNIISELSSYGVDTFDLLGESEDDETQGAIGWEQFVEINGKIYCIDFGYSS